MSLLVLLGGQKSGKSSTAATLAAGSGRAVTVVAPAEIRGDDPEMAERIARHRAERPDDWRTLETFDLVGALESIDRETFVIIDALDTWLLATAENEGLFDDSDTAPLGETGRATQERILGRVEAFASTAAERAAEVAVIAGQPGLGMVPLGATPRRYADLHGLACRILVDRSAASWLVVAGRRIPLVDDVRSERP